MSDVIFTTGIDLDALARHLDDGVDPGGNRIETFVDEAGGWPLRCCLAESYPGERIAIIAWSPFPWDGAYRETGPIVVHADRCDGFEPSAALPAELDRRPMVLRPYGVDRRIAYHRVTTVDAGSSVSDGVAAVLEHDDVDFVHGRNVVGGCYAFTARRGA